MNKTIEVHLKTAIWKRLVVEVPEDEDPVAFTDEMIAYDPICADYPKEDVAYMSETEEILEGQYFLPDEDYEDEYNLYAHCKFPTLEANNLMVLMDKEMDNPMRALYELQKQARKNSEILADEIVKMNQYLKNTLTVSQLLEIIKQY